ncbi:hypothetical protein BDW68DRAFT_170654 [Aspergillus falconensis]
MVECDGAIFGSIVGECFFTLFFLVLYTPFLFFYNPDETRRTVLEQHLRIIHLQRTTDFLNG